MKVTRFTIGEVNKKGYRGKIDISIKENGDLDMGLFEFGELVEKFMGGDHEVDVIVAKEDKDSVLLQLIQDKFKDVSEFKKWLKEHDIPFTESSW